jgi:hypothetical protein
VINETGTPSARRNGLGTRSFLVVTLYLLIIEASSANATAVQPVSTKLTVSTKTKGLGVRNEESWV